METTLGTAPFSTISWLDTMPTTDDVSDDQGEGLDPIDEFISSQADDTCADGLESYTPAYGPHEIDENDDAAPMHPHHYASIPTPSLQGPAAVNIDFVDPQDL